MRQTIKYPAFPQEQNLHFWLTAANYEQDKDVLFTINKITYRFLFILRIEKVAK